MQFLDCFFIDLASFWAPIWEPPGIQRITFSVSLVNLEPRWPKTCQLGAKIALKSLIWSQSGSNLTQLDFNLAQTWSNLDPTWLQLCLSWRSISSQRGFEMRKYIVRKWHRKNNHHNVHVVLAVAVCHRIHGLCFLLLLVSSGVIATGIHWYIDR